MKQLDFKIDIKDKEEDDKWLNLDLSKERNRIAFISYFVKMYSNTLNGNDASCLIPENFSSSHAKINSPFLNKHALES
jgi:hypothetical protein